jgi:hypothetical protein
VFAQWRRSGRSFRKLAHDPGCVIESIIGMKKIVRLAVVLHLTSAPIISYAQTVPYQLSSGEYGVAIELGLQEDATSLVSSLRYGISQNLSASLAAGLGFADEDLILPEGLVLPGISIPPAPVLGIGFGTVNRLGQTGLDYWSSIDFGVTFGEVVYDPTGETLITLRATAMIIGVGFMKKITIGSDLALVSLVGISNTQTWVDWESEIMNIAETESDNVWSGQMGLIVEVSTKMSIMGTVGFSFQEEYPALSIANAEPSRNIIYNIALSFRP